MKDWCLYGQSSVRRSRIESEPFEYQNRIGFHNLPKLHELKGTCFNFHFIGILTLDGIAFHCFLLDCHSLNTIRLPSTAFRYVYSFSAHRIFSSSLSLRFPSIRILCSTECVISLPVSTSPAADASTIGYSRVVGN